MTPAVGVGGGVGRDWWGGKGRRGKVEGGKERTEGGSTCREGGACSPPNIRNILGWLRHLIHAVEVIGKLESEPSGTSAILSACNLFPIN